ncbi:MAG: hypothetical protein D6775_04855 [Caldilineae bacterium]|nr:MAG: hypothetical protein D6775_04855 [Caldilineae bacterium]
MPETSPFTDYLADLSRLLPPPSSAAPHERAGEAARPPSPFGEDQLDEVRAFLQKSAAVREKLLQDLEEAATAHERSLAEIRLLGAAAADLAIAERLIRAATAESETTMRDTTGGSEHLIRKALENPEELIAPVALPAAYRGSENQKLLETTFKCLTFIRQQTVLSTKDAITGLLAMDLAVLKEAVEMLGKDAEELVSQASKGFVRTAVNYVFAATDKIRALLGPEGEEKVRQAVLDFIEKIEEDEFLTEAVERLLQTQVIYHQSRPWINGYSGPATALELTAEQIASLQGSFSGRVKLADTVLKGLAVVRLLPALNTPPWGPVAVAAAYLSVVGYVLFSAYDHVDSDRFPFLDRVRGVRGVLIDQLGVPDTPLETDTSDTE